MKLSHATLTAGLVVLGATAHAERVYISSNHVRVVDVEARTVDTIIDLGESYVRDMVFHPDGTTAYVAHSKGIARIDVATSEIVGTLSDRPVNDLVVRADENALYSLQHTAGGPYEVVVYSLDDGTEVRRYGVDQKALDIVAPPGTDRLYTTNIHRSHLSAFDRTTGAEAATVAVDASVIGETRNETYIQESLLSLDGRTIYVVLNGEHAGVSSYDALTGAHRGDVSLGHPAYVRDSALSPDGSRLYLSALDHLSVVDLAEEAEVAWVSLDAPHQGIAVSADGTRLYLANPVATGERPAGGTIAVLDAGDYSLIDRIPVDGISPFKVAAVP